MSVVLVTTKGQAGRGLWSLLQPEAMSMSMGCTVSRVHIDVCNLSYHQRPCGGLWHLMQLEVMCCLFSGLPPMFWPGSGFLPKQGPCLWSVLSLGTTWRSMIHPPTDWRLGKLDLLWYQWLQTRNWEGGTWKALWQPYHPNNCHFHPPQKKTKAKQTKKVTA